MDNNQKPKQKMGIFKRILFGIFIGFAGLLILGIIISIFDKPEYYKEGLDNYNKQNYTLAYNDFNNVKPDDKNYKDAIAKIKEIKPIVDSLEAIASQNRQATQDNTKSETDTKKKEEEDIKNNTITSKKLTAAYEANEVNADNNFKGKTIYVTGRISDIKKDLTDNIYVTLEGDELFRQVQCYFEDKETAAKLKKGQKVTFKGKCDGLMMNVLMKDCELIDK